MTPEQSAWARFFPVLLRFRLLPEPTEVRDLRLKGSAELAAIAGEISRAASEHGLAELEKKYETCCVRFTEMIDRERQNIDNYVPGVFSCEDPWRRLAIGLLISGGEPGFELDIAKADLGADRDYHRRSLMESILLTDERRRAANLAAAKPAMANNTTKRPLTVKQAAELAAREIARRAKAGETAYGSPPEPGTLQDLWCKQNSGARRGRPGEYLPTYVEDFRLTESFMSDLLAETEMLSWRLENAHQKS